MRRLLTRRKRRGLTYRELAEESGISERTLSWWAWKLRREERDGISFVELQVSGEAASGEIEVVLAGGHRLRVPAGFDEDTLRRLVVALASC